MFAHNVPSSVSCVKLEITNQEGSGYRYKYTGSKMGEKGELQSGLLAENHLLGEILFLRSVNDGEKVLEPHYIADHSSGEYLIVFSCDPECKLKPVKWWCENYIFNPLQSALMFLSDRAIHLRLLIKRLNSWSILDMATKSMLSTKLMAVKISVFSMSSIKCLETLKVLLCVDRKGEEEFQGIRNHKTLFNFFFKIKFSNHIGS